MYEGTWQEADGRNEEIMKSRKDGNLEPQRTRAAAYDVAHLIRWCSSYTISTGMPNNLCAESRGLTKKLLGN
jgi:hypothetical protein